MMHAYVSGLTLQSCNIYFVIYKCLIDGKSIFMSHRVNQPGHEQHLNATGSLK